jgi:hypothetical protein
VLRVSGSTNYQPIQGMQAVSTSSPPATEVLRLRYSSVRMPAPLTAAKLRAILVMSVGSNLEVSATARDYFRGRLLLP